MAISREPKLLRFSDGSVFSCNSLTPANLFLQIDPLVRTTHVTKKSKQRGTVWSLRLNCEGDAKKTKIIKFSQLTWIQAETTFTCRFYVAEITAKLSVTSAYRQINTVINASFENFSISKPWWIQKTY